MEYGIWNMECGMWNVECGMDSVGDCCSKISRRIFDAQGIGDIWDADRIEGRALARPEDSSIYIYIYIYMLLLFFGMGTWMVKVACTIVNDGLVHLCSSKLQEKIRAPSYKGRQVKTNM